jgi:tetratricopeptide (TPR) repeat protein
LRTIDLVAPQTERLSDGDRQSLARWRAESLADAGRREEAREAYGKLAAQYPRDGAIQEGYAVMLREGGDRPSLEAALAAWRQIEKKSPVGSERWFRAKYEVASLQYELGNRAQAAAVIRQLQVLEPELGGEELKGRFLELLEKAMK